MTAANALKLEFAGPASEMARAAGSLLRSHYECGVATEYKGEVDIVTVADRESERLLVEKLRARWPEHGIVGEEGTRARMDCEYRWYIDPLDGTTNFSHGFPAFCVSMGLEHRPTGTAENTDGELIAAVIYDPLRDEMFLAERSHGAFLNDRRVHVSATETMAESLIATGFPSRKRHGNPNVHFYHEVTLRSHGVRRAGSAALDLAYVACGRLDGYWEFKLNSWDTAAGVLLVREAGGVVTYIDNGPFHLASAEVLASNGKIHAELVHLFGDIFAGRNLASIPTPVEFAAARKASSA
ncbi:MAG TPA: inositol monophosphatase family protein [Acidobacteriaceae bacterium]|nr:inositol monophosphatase family protein [Acidobacteriaceae bacterium]